METIFALSTAPGKAGVAVVRVSGPEASGTLTALGAAQPAARQATLATLSIEGAALDQALVLYFKAPHSFTGEDVVEYHIHGGRAVIRRLLAHLGSFSGLRPAEPGEFTKRGFLNGKMDLTAAEGLADLIDAETEAQRKQALRFLQGDGAAFYHRLRETALEAMALTEAYIDFPDEDIPPQVLAETDEKVQGAAAAIETQLADNGVSERVRDGVRVVILGPPNAGKSSIMNLLARRDVAIVSDVAGTTRDVIEVHLDIGGYAVMVADTAGIREAEGAIEAEGIRRSFARAEDADIRIVVLDATANMQDGTLLSLITPDTILLLNKTDLALPSPLPSVAGVIPIVFSAQAQTGMDGLMEALSSRIQTLCAAESSFIARGRHRHHLTQALAHLRHYLQTPENGLELRSEDLRRAAAEVGRITGTITADEVLGQIFGRFCIGK